jgi:hypothetical protein
MKRKTAAVWQFFFYGIGKAVMQYHINKDFGENMQLR